MARLKIYADENVNPAIVNGLRRRGVEAMAAVEVGNLGLSDEQQLQYAVKEKAVLFTHDVDLLVIAKRWTHEGKEHWGVIYVHQDQLSIGQCIYRLKEYADILDAEDMKNRVEFL
ncbi:MAG: hypothetical protein D6681_12950 [Calditrichaeota bacterium]|nr:MAG: hypothetical protein D6681_12950 [Calditrichota bacterium]